MNAFQSYSQIRKGEYGNIALKENYSHPISAADSNEMHNLRKLARKDSVYILGAETESFIFQQQQNRLDIFK